jgi:hypothetical protein
LCGIIRYRVEREMILMAKLLAWDVMNKVVMNRLQNIDVEINSPFIQSDLDWDNGVAIPTSKGTIHVLGTGEIVDENNILKY